MANAEKLRKESEVKRSKIESRIKELDSIMSCLYEDRALGKITSERYEKLASGYEKEQSEIKAELEILSIQLENMEYQDKAVQDFIENAKADLEMEELTPKLLKLFISRVEVYEKPEKHSKTCGNDVVIHYSFHSMHKPMPVLTPSKNRTFTQAVC